MRSVQYHPSAQKRREHAGLRAIARKATATSLERPLWFDSLVWGLVTFTFVLVLL